MTENLDSKLVASARIQTFTGTDWASGGLLLGDDEHDLKFAHQATGRPNYRPRDGETFSQRLPGLIAYAGPMVRHFGHFVAECIHRVVPARQFFGAERFLFVGRGKDINTYDSVPLSLRRVLSFLDVEEENFILINENTEVESLALVQQGSSIGTEPHPQYLELMREHSTRKLDELYGKELPSKRVYVCGRRGPYGVILGAEYLEGFLERAGFLIFRPEDHPYSFQLHVYRSAETLIFAEGSAIHGASLLGREMMGDVQVIIRRPETPYIIQRFRAELVGRCRRSELCFCCRYLGSLVRLNSIQVNHLGISMYNLSALRQIFYKNNIEKFANFDPKSYFEICEKDLMDYVKFSVSHPKNECTPFDLSSLFARFELVRRADIIEWT